MGEAPSSGVHSRRIRLRGHVQGVGFRPYVYRLAHEFGVTGWVQNQLGEVEVLAQGDETILDRFEQALLDKAPSARVIPIRNHESARSPPQCATREAILSGVASTEDEGIE